MVLQVVNHATYHRGNITAMLRQMGHASVMTEYALYLVLLNNIKRLCRSGCEQGPFYEANITLIHGFSFSENLECYTELVGYLSKSRAKESLLKRHLYLTALL